MQQPEIDGKIWIPGAQKRAEITSMMLLPDYGLSLFLHMGNFSLAPTSRIANLVWSFLLFQCFLEVHLILSSRDASWNQTVCKVHVTRIKAVKGAIAVSDKYVPPRSLIFDHGNIK